MKFTVVFLFAIIFVANAKLITLSDMLKSYEMTNEIEEGAAVANQALYIPMTLKTCSNSGCDYICRLLGFNHGACVSSTTCHCYN